MEISVAQINPFDIQADALVVPFFQESELKENVINEFLVYAKDNMDFAGKINEMAFLPTYNKLQAKSLLFLGLGKKEEFSLNKLRVASSKAFRRLNTMKKINNCAILIDDIEQEIQSVSKSVVEGLIIGTYSFDKYKSDKKEDEKISKVVFVSQNSTEANIGLEKGKLFAYASNYARDLINEPAEYITPAKLAQLASEIQGIDLKVYNQEEIKNMGMGAFLAVGQGSRHEAKFIHMTYKPENQPNKKIAIVGKGITFDSGGLDIKPAASMLDMKGDMAGAAAVLGIMKTLAFLKPNVEVHAIIAACENMPASASYKPGDVLVAMNGKTIEVDNTDAEGRLTLADALCYAEKLAPDAIIDIATLTGACCVALGKVASGLLGNDEDLIKSIKVSADTIGEYLWEMPMFEEYFDDMKSDIADFKNAGTRYGGTSAAALFLKHFVEKTPWVHIDIAGTSILNKPLREFGKGPTGVGVRTILNYICNL